MPAGRAGADPTSALRELSAHPSGSGIFLDFDGTLSEIVAHPSVATAVDGAAQVLAGLASRFASVAVVSGRPRDEVAELIRTDGVMIEGTYGLTSSIASRVEEEVRDVASRVGGSWVELKGASVALHYRGAPDPAAAHRRLADALAPVASAGDLEVIEGKMVLELVPRGVRRKGGVVERLARASGVSRVLYAGDDAADLEAFEVLRSLERDGALSTCVCVAVAGPETPADLSAAANVVVEGPRGLVRLLRGLLV